MVVKTFNDYQRKCEETAMFNEKIAIPYITMKLNGEVAELSEKFMNYEGKDLIDKEIGDCYWYIATLSKRVGMDLMNLNTAYSLIPCDFKIFEMNEQLLFINTKAGLIAEVVGKAIRDDEGEINDEKRNIIIENLSDLFTGLQIFSQKFKYEECNVLVGVTRLTKDIMTMNLNKLAVRHAKGMIKGSGDEREL
jgi:NTP pyrophosphatase (non-canonical NTP hydrolase)